MTAPSHIQLEYLPIGEIKVNEADRQRKKLGEDKKLAKQSFQSLKDSIAANGMLQPIGVSRERELLYGYRRLSAAVALGWTQVPVIFDPERELTELDKQVLELEENIQRLDLSWHEKDLAVAKINEIRQKQDPSWGQKKTAAELGMQQSEVSRSIQMAKMLEIFPELKEAKSHHAAASQAKSKAKTVLRNIEVKSNPKKYEETSKKIVCGKAEELILSLPDGFTKHIVTDGPFGIGYDKRPAAEGAHEAYEDSPESYRKRTAILAPHMYRIMGSDGFFIWFLAHDHFEWTRDLFRSVGFDVDPVPGLWDRSDGRCYTVRPDKWFGKGYDIFLHCVKGDPQMINRSRSRGKFGSGNVFRHKPIDPKDKDHIVERPIEIYQDILQCISLEGEKIVDLFSGSGKVAAAAASMKRDFWACDTNPNHVTLTIQNVYLNTPQAGG